jgi:molybdopterin-guanine dinucleotide biosynthesis protein
MREFEQRGPLTVHHLLAELYEGVDWVLVEGFKDSDLLKIEVWRAAARTAGALPRRRFHVSPWPPTAPRPCPGRPSGRCWI